MSISTAFQNARQACERDTELNALFNEWDMHAGAQFIKHERLFSVYYHASKASGKGTPAARQEAMRRLLYIASQARRLV